MGGKQLGFSDYKLTTAKKQTKREKFLSEMEVVLLCPPEPEPKLLRCGSSTIVAMVDSRSALISS